MNICHNSTKHILSLNSVQSAVRNAAMTEVVLSSLSACKEDEVTTRWVKVSV